MIKKRFKSEQRVQKRVYRSTPVTKDFLEKKFIIESLSQIPLDELKQLVNFEYFDPSDKSLWNKSYEQDKFLNSLSNQDCDLMRMDLIIHKRVKHD